MIKTRLKRRIFGLNFLNNLAERGRLQSTYPLSSYASDRKVDDSLPKCVQRKDALSIGAKQSTGCNNSSCQKLANRIQRRILVTMLWCG